MKLPVDYTFLTRYERRAVREEYIRIQGGKCWYCNEPLTEKSSKTVCQAVITESLFPPNFFKWPVHLHHDHETGLTIGAVHARCNAYLWEYLGQ